MQQQLALLLPGSSACRPDLIPKDQARWRLLLVVVLIVAVAAVVLVAVAVVCLLSRCLGVALQGVLSMRGRQGPSRRVVTMSPFMSMR